MELFLVTAVLLGLGFAGIAVKIWAKKDGEFAGTCASNSPFLNEEGDIHTKKNDHIEWNEIENIVSKNCTILKLEDYLVCREVSLQKPIYEKFKDTCSDMRILIAMKNII